MKRVVLLLYLAIGANLCFGSVIHVPSDQPTIQQGIDASVSGDTVLVAPSTYTENIVIDGKAIFLSSTDGREATFIEPSNADSCIVMILNSDDTTCVFEGFTVRYGNSVGIVCSNSSPVIRECEVESCGDIGIEGIDTGARIRNNLIHDCHGYGIHVDGQSQHTIEIERNSVHSTIGDHAGGVYISNSIDARVSGNLIWGNLGGYIDFEYSVGIRAIATTQEVRIRITNNTIVGNLRGIFANSGNPPDAADSAFLIFNNIIASNTAEAFYGCCAAIDYNCVSGNGYNSGAAGPNGITVAPLFADTLNNDYSLSCVSPCIDAGNPDPQYNDPNGSRNDMGALPYVHSGSVVHVPEDFVSIQGAVNHACDGDTVLVSPGSYTENISFMGKAISLLSEGGRDATFVQAANPNANVLAFDHDEDTNSVIDGFTIGGTNDASGIYCNYAGPIIRNCDISSCSRDGDGAGITCSGGSIKLRNNRIHDNHAEGTGGGIAIGLGAFAGLLEIVSNEVFNNSAKIGTGIACNSPNQTLISRNVLWGNEATEADVNSGALHCGYANKLIVNNTVVGNTKGITIFSGAGTDIRNNIVALNSENGLVPFEASFDYNDVWENGSDNFGGPNGIVSDPLFVDPAHNDYSLNYGSPCIDAGDPDHQYDDPNGTRNDIGAIWVPYLAPPYVINFNLGVSGNGDTANTLTPTFFWSYFDTAASTQEMYELEVGSDSLWDVAEMWATGEVASSDTNVTYAGAALANQTRYWLRIRLNNGSVWGDWHYAQFVVDFDTYPQAMNIGFGPDAHSDTVFSVPPTIYWSYVDTAASIQKYYEIEVGTDTLWDVAEMWASGPVESSDTSAVYAGLTLENHREYQLRMRVNDGDKWGNWGYSRLLVQLFNVTIQVPAKFATIQQGIDYAFNGDTVLVAPETYRENLLISDRNIYLVSAHGKGATFVDADLSYAPVVNVTGATDTNCVIEGFTLRNATSSSGVSCDQTSPIVRDCNIGFNQNGVTCVESGARIHDCRIHENAVIGVSLELGDTPYILEVIGNDIYENGGGIRAWASGAGSLIKGNLIRNNENTGISTSTESGNSATINNTIVGNFFGVSIVNRKSGDDIKYECSYMLNNIIAQNTRYGIVHSGKDVAGCLEHAYNNVWGNPYGDGPPSYIDMSENPLFVDTTNHDYSLQCGSPCIDAGDPDPAYNDPDGSRNDIGAIPFLHESNILQVPQQYGTIQAAINAACDFDTIIVADGHYYERLNLFAKGLVLASEILIDGDTAHTANTIIDADTSVIGVSDTGSVINAWGYEGYYKPTEIRGFTLRGGTGGVGGCMIAWRDSIALRDCSIVDNSGVALLGHHTRIYFYSCSLNDCPGGIDWLHDELTEPASSYFTYSTLRSIPVTASSRIQLVSCFATDCDFRVSTQGYGFMYIDSSTLIRCQTSAAMDAYFQIKNSYGFDVTIATISEEVSIENCVLIGDIDITGSFGNASVSSNTIVGTIQIRYYSEPAANEGQETRTVNTSLENNILVATDSQFIYCSRPVNLSVSCCDVVCADSAWFELGDQSTVDTSNVFFLDPMFCDTAAHDFHLNAASPCAPANNSCGVLIGALDVGCSYLCGDVDNSGMIDIDDAVYLICYVYMSGPIPVPPDSGDVNCDGKIDLLDIVGIVNYLFRGGNAPCDIDGDGVPDCG